ncbi:MAG: glycerol-3-phosphate dehydrogenase/oxidase, partial [Mucilaginibacter sp.]
AQTCLEQGATVLNYFRVTDLLKESGKISGVIAKDVESGRVYQLKSKAVINATGVFVDDLLQKDEPHRMPLVRPSQGIHIVVDGSFMPGADAIMIPKTDDGRVLFVVPWHGRLLIGTTDTPLNEHRLEPVALEEEISFVMRTAGKYLTKPPERHDVRSIFAGLRPLAAPQHGSAKTKEISRSHKLIVSASGLITITGGKWTTYRRMAQDTVDKAIEAAQLQPRVNITKDLSIHGNKKDVDRNDHLYVYGSDREALLDLLKEEPMWGEKLHQRMEYIKAEVIWAVRHEMARTVEDVLARRVRALFLDVRAAIDMAPEVARLMARELKRDKKWENAQVADFNHIAEGYLLLPAKS